MRWVHFEGDAAACLGKKHGNQFLPVTADLIGLQAQPVIHTHVL
jgi:hypothetical protein